MSEITNNRLKVDSIGIKVYQNSWLIPLYELLSLATWFQDSDGTRYCVNVNSLSKYKNRIKHKTEERATNTTPIINQAVDPFDRIKSNWGKKPLPISDETLKSILKKTENLLAEKHTAKQFRHEGKHYFVYSSLKGKHPIKIYQLGKKIGSGSYGYVQEALAIHRGDGKKKAFKCPVHQNKPNQTEQTLIKMKHILVPKTTEQFEARNVLMVQNAAYGNFKGIPEKKYKLWKVSDPLSDARLEKLAMARADGDLDDLRKKMQHLSFNEWTVMVEKIQAQLEQGLKTTRQAGLFHTDIKQGNILYTLKPFKVWFTDWGNARTAEEIYNASLKTGRLEIYGTFWNPKVMKALEHAFRDRDFVQFEKLLQKFDIASLGITLLDLLIDKTRTILDDATWLQEPVEPDIRNAPQVPLIDAIKKMYRY